MAQPTKPPVTSVWASTATDNITPTDAFIAAGWPLSTTPPSRGRFNWLLNYLYNGIRYFSRRGIPDYDAAETYMTNDRTMGQDGLTYVSLVDNNTNHTPASSPTQWARWGFKSTDFPATLASNGSTKLPNGLIVQWGTVLCANANQFYTFTFPTPFPNAALAVTATASNGSTTALSASANGPTPSSVQVTVNNTNCNVTVFAIGF